MSDNDNAEKNKETSVKKNEDKAGEPRVIERYSRKERGRVFDWIDVILKLFIAGIGVWITYLGNEYQKSYTSSQLLVQQEKGDTNIRAQMFGKITDRLMKPISGEDSLLQDALLSQVLALNFHELIELKPLMINLDKRLSKVIAKNNLNTNSDYDLKDYIEARDSLQSVARRIRDRQVTALIYKQVSGKSSVERDLTIKLGSVQYVSFVRDGNVESHSCVVKHKNIKNEINTAANGCLRQIIKVRGQDMNESMHISVNKADWNRENFEVSFNPVKSDIKPVLPKGYTGELEPVSECEAESDKDPGKTSYQAGHKSFKVTWYDFPYTDNTLLANGNRHSIFIDKICKDDENGADAVRLGILYFPSDYYPSRERPVSYKQLNKKLGTKLN